MEHKIIGDSCCDYPQKAMDFLTRVPLTIDLGGEEIVDESGLDTAEFVRKMGECPSAPRSACPSPESFLQEFKSSKGDTYVVTLSDGLSGSYNSAVQAMRIYHEGGGGNNIHIFNSKSAAAGQVGICMKINDLCKEKLPFHDIVARVQTYIDQLTTLFVLEDLEVFRKNGRLGPLQAVITGKLKIKLVMAATQEGTVCKKASALSIRQALNKMVNMVSAGARKSSGKIARLVITHCQAPDRAEYVKNAIEEVCDVAESIICRSSGISSMYAGPGGVIVSF